METIRQLRKENKITMKHLGEILGVSESAVSQYENGKRQPDQEMLAKIADYFDVSVDYLLGRTDTPKPSSLDEQLSGVDFALWSEAKDMTDSEKQDIINYMKFKKTQRNE